MEPANKDNSPGIALLDTKFFAPKWRAGSVSRPHLIKRLSQGIQGKVTLVAAPAGSGKTTLIAEWLATLDPATHAICWVSLDSVDNDPGTFWAYLITALQRADPRVSGQALALVGSSRAPAIEQILTSLLNDLSAISREFTLILDDVHVIESTAIHEGLGFLIDHLPDHVHIVLVSRADPPLPLARLRARGDLNEIRVADLRFSAAETGQFFQSVMHLDISGDEAAALQHRTEGWIAGLQLAALSLRGRADVPAFIADFTGDDRYIVDYLIEEVLHRQPPRVRTFLLRTSIVERVSGPLCDAVTSGQESRELLEQLDRANLFLVALDNRREWFRYHHLFADVLRNVLATESPEIVPELHNRASAWFASRDLTAEAIRHALLAGNYARAAELIELAATGMRQHRQEATLVSWIRQLPEYELRRRPVLSVIYGAMLLQSGRLDHVEELFANAEQLLAEPTPEIVVSDEAEFLRLPASLAVHRSGIALALGQIDVAAERASHALTVVSPADHMYRGAAESVLGLTAAYRGDLELAWRLFSAGMESLYQAGNVSDTVGGMVGGTDLLIGLGRLREAARSFEHALKRAELHGNPTMRGTADMYTGLAALNLEWNDLDVVRQLLDKSRSLGDVAAFPQNPWRMLALNADLKVIDGAFALAIELLDEAEAVHTTDFFPNFRPIRAMKARLRIRAGDLDGADRWAQEHDLGNTDSPSYLREYEQITYARLLLAKHRAGEASGSLDRTAGLLDRLLVAAREGKRTGSEIELLILRSLVDFDRGDRESARAPLEQAITLAEPERYTRVFINEGDPMRTLLSDLNTGYADHLQGMFATSATPVRSSPQEGLVEPLTPRELEILRLIADGLRNEEIADQLFISLATVKRHIANTYGKLGVTHRTEAVARANALGLLT